MRTNLVAFAGLAFNLLTTIASPVEINESNAISLTEANAIGPSVSVDVGFSDATFSNLEANDKDQPGCVEDLYSSFAVMEWKDQDQGWRMAVPRDDHRYILHSEVPELYCSKTDKAGKRQCKPCLFKADRVMLITSGRCEVRTAPDEAGHNVRSTIIKYAGLKSSFPERSFPVTVECAVGASEHEQGFVSSDLAAEQASSASQDKRDLQKRHDWAMDCAGRQDYTNECQKQGGYYCSRNGWLQYTIKRITACERGCVCTNLVPKPRCFVGIIGNSYCIRSVDRQDEMYEVAADGTEDVMTATSKPHSLVKRHDWAMQCGDSQLYTQGCQRNGGYYCNSNGWLRHTGQYVQRCSEDCTCVNLAPKPQCFVGIVGNTYCLRNAEGQDALFEVLADGTERALRPSDLPSSEN